MENKDNKTLKDIFEVTLSDITRNHQHQAPVKIPDLEELTVKLVRLSLIEKLVESKEDYDTYLSALFTILGTFLGALLTIFTNDIDNISTKYVIFFVCLISIVSIFLIVRIVTLRNRYLRVKNKVFNSENK